MCFRAAGTAILIALAAAGNCLAEIKQLRPGFNLFTPRQDVQIGKEAVPEIERQMGLVRNPELDGYLNLLLRKLEESRYARSLEPDGSRAGMFPFEIHAVYGKNINAFSLPGGPIFVNTAAIAAAENEAQLAGVIAHEMSHIVLRHPTNQASKRNLVALPALLAGALTGNSLLGQLAQIGIVFTANSALLKFSRTDEAEADYNGAEIMADAGYDPRELARFFQHLEEKTGQQGTLVQFLSDHPNPGNRAEAIDEEMRELPHRRYVTDETGQFLRIRDMVRRLPVSGSPSERAREAAPAAPGEAAPSEILRRFTGRSFSLEYPENWQVHRDGSEDAITIAPAQGVVAGPNGQTSIGYGIQVNYYAPEGRDPDLQRDTEALIRRLEQNNPQMRIGRAARTIQVDGNMALLSTLYSRSPYGNEREVDVVVTTARPRGLFYVVFIAPESQFDSVQAIFEKIVRSIHFD
ncbi:MAG TPA: M48 family metalloprotease [Bryobacteraceae bacterium]|nr:M48 family metalloprotease [Bryobacteraceae bacterium]